jgi:hypothetical protein
MLVGLHLRQTGPTSKAPQRQRWIGEMRVRIPPQECSLRTDVSPILVATADKLDRGECR